MDEEFRKVGNYSDDTNIFITKLGTSSSPMLNSLSWDFQNYKNMLNNHEEMFDQFMGAYRRAMCPSDTLYFLYNFVNMNLDDSGDGKKKKREQRCQI